MNNQRRKEIKSIIKTLEEAVERLNSVCSDEEDAFDNMPEGIQDSDRGDTMQENIEALEEAVESIEEVIGNLEVL